MSSITTILASQQATSAWQEDFYKHLHAHPELSFQEAETARLVAEKLQAFGYEVHGGIGKTGVVGILRNGAGATLLARADMDALPVTEATGLPYASTVQATDAGGNTVGVSHACGHDVHVTCLLGAAELLAGHRDAWSGTYIVLFQPAEEVAGGAKAMVDDGLARLIPKPDVALAQHVLAFPAGRLGTRIGAVLSAGDSIHITLHGKGAHGSMPQSSVDPVVLAALIVVRLQTIVSRETQPGEFGVLTIGSNRAGSKSNIIADRADLLLNLRTYDRNVRSRIIAAIERMVNAECVASGSPQPPEFAYYDQYPLTENDAEVTAVVTAAFQQHFGVDWVFDLGRLTASEDFSHLPDALGTPYTFWGLGGTDPELYAQAAKAGRIAEDIPVNHSKYYAPVLEPTLDHGTQAMVVAAMAWLGHEALKPVSR
ncbi:amidohydrolase [Rhodanobacter sp. B04]|uniref:M20 family metallopeptidase n=1 Tax=Rhodanobacter sp. B04 TaxID=1945860 RepID=UPI0009845CE5|nr:M20 family metallopeptidase [Rhodanobacter sp. B04]OOG61944.1 amidohydrolase [Rhodanobacter sp. B04]